MCRLIQYFLIPIDNHSYINIQDIIIMIDGISIENIKPSQLLLRFKMLSIYISHHQHRESKASFQHDTQSNQYLPVIQELNNLQNFIMQQSRQINHQETQSLLILNEENQKAIVLDQQIKKVQGDYENALMRIWRRISENNKIKIQQSKKSNTNRVDNQKFAYLTADILKMQRTANLKINTHRQAMTKMISEISQTINQEHQHVSTNYKESYTLIEDYRLKINEKVTKYRQFVDKSNQEMSVRCLQVKERLTKEMKREEQLRMNNCKQMKSILRQLRNRVVGQL